MNILFIDNFVLNFGVSYLAAVLRKEGHHVALMNHPFSKSADADIYTNPEHYYDFEAIAELVLASNSDLIAFSVWSPNFQFFRQLSAAIRRKCSIPILVGGVLPTLRPDLFIPGTACDVVFRGEAETSICALVTHIANGEYRDMPNIVYRSPSGEAVYNPMSSSVGDLDSLPIRDHELYPNLSGSLFVITSRGCAMRCTYCSAGQYSRIVACNSGKLVRKRSVDSVIGEIKAALVGRKYSEIYFYDDFFITASSWLSEFTERYRAEINLPYYCIAFPATINRKIAHLLKSSGCKNVLMGFQTANTEYKAQILHRNEPIQRVIDAMDCLRAEGISFSLDHIFNLPGETEKDIEQSMNFYIENRVHSLMIFFLNYYPDSGITRMALEQGTLTAAQYESIMHNEIVGEQSYRGTILDRARSDMQIRWAVLFRLIPLLPGWIVKGLFRRRLHRYFPTDRNFYYLLSGLSVAKGMGVLSLLNTLFLAFGINSSILSRLIARLSRRT